MVIELQGGNDGLSTLVPYEDDTYHDLRPTTAFGGGDVLFLCVFRHRNRRGAEAAALMVDRVDGTRLRAGIESA